MSSINYLLHGQPTYRYKMESFDYVQTFQIDPESVNNAASAMITSVEIYFKRKPLYNLIHRIIDGFLYSHEPEGPGVTVAICEVKNNEPDISAILASGLVSISSHRIFASNFGTQSTTIAFDSPVPVVTGKSYGLVIKFDAPDFEIWERVRGHRIVSPIGPTELLSPGSQGRGIGLLYRGSFLNGVWGYNAIRDRDIKFKINVANFSGVPQNNNNGNSNNVITSSNSTFIFVNKPFEFLTIAGFTQTFTGGEWVYKSVSNETGTLRVDSANSTITGVGTNFTNNHLGLHAIVSNGSFSDVLKIVSVANSTSMTVERLPNLSSNTATYKIPPVGKVYYTDYTKNRVVLEESNAANTNFKFSANDTIIGVRSGASAVISSIDRYDIDSFTPRFLIGNPATSKFKIEYALTTEANVISSSVGALQLDQVNQLPYKGAILSRSQEVEEAGLYGNKRKSAFANISFDAALQGANTFTLPYISNENLDFFTYAYDINSTTLETRYGIVDYDTEVEKNGIGKSKYLSKKISFAENRYAEDILCYLTAYRPAGTDIKVYAKIHNSADKEAFDDKAWTPLELKGNLDRFSGENPNDFIEYTYGFPQTPDVNMQLSGHFSVAQGNNIVTASVDPSGSVSAGQLVKISAPLFPENHEVFPVNSANSTAIVLSRAVNNINVNGDVLVETLKYNTVAWNNIANDNVARYVTTSKVEFDTFNTMQFKVVLLADNSNIIPRVEMFQGIGVSA